MTPPQIFRKPLFFTPFLTPVVQCVELGPSHRSRAYTGLVAPPVRGAAALGPSARARRRSILLSPGEINDEMARLRDVVNKIMISEPVPMEELLGFKNLFKIDTGRRFFTFMLKEYSEKVLLLPYYAISSLLL